ncbi:hypothetical protein K0B96_11625 [Horticoccus luteus]|uniref:Uncharacterized protein n=1 Tax=Horticoccus luteus TaxID=2862869 RepID=A0A8F9TTX5_9BACT|nr:hypothetical protein [Horticoccus luteus]QYM77961.1 hypothetical protein K0B96_11625 [Horticoccus luteus]
MFSSRSLLVVLFLLAASRLCAAVSLVGQVGTLFQSDATTPIPAGSIAILVADTNKTSHAGLANPVGTTLTVGSYLGGNSDDLIVGLYSASDLGGGIIGVDFGGTTLTYGDSFSAGTDLWLLWFPSQSVAGAVLGAGVPFGSYRSDTIDFASGSDIAFVAPRDGSISSLFAFSASTGYGLASNAELSATALTTATQPPSDLTLSRRSFNILAGANAFVGSLATTDADSTAFSYTLVAGPGDTDNAHFNLSGAALRASDPSSFSLGSYSVRIQTDDGDGGILAKTFTVTASYVGAYFGTFASGGSWALHVRDDNSAVFLAFLPARGSVLVANLTLASDGSFSVTDSELTADGAVPVAIGATGHPASPAASLYTLSGSIGAMGTVSGSITGIGDTLTGTLAPATGPAQNSAGFYSASALGTDHGSTYTIVGASGQALIVTTGDTSVDGATGTIDAQGHLTATTQQNAQLTLAIDASGHSLTADLTPAGASTPISFAGLSDTITPEARLVNLSVRSATGTGSETLIVGFVVGGSGDKTLLLRGIGPGLTTFGVTNAVADPGMHLFTGTNEVDANDDWDGSATTAQTFARVGAFPLTAGSKDASLLSPLSAGVYSFHISASAAASGVALAEIYDTDTAASTTHLVNISARTQVGSGQNILIAGFVVGGNAPQTLLLRGVGPTLAGFGVTGTLADPQLELFRDGTSIAHNDNWGGTPALKNAFALVGAFPFGSDSSQDAALLVTLPPGVYSAQVSGVAGATGVALVEIFLLP